MQRRKVRKKKKCSEQKFAKTKRLAKKKKGLQKKKKCAEEKNLPKRKFEKKIQK